MLSCFSHRTPRTSLRTRGCLQGSLLFRWRGDLAAAAARCSPECCLSVESLTESFSSAFPASYRLRWTSFVHFTHSIADCDVAISNTRGFSEAYSSLRTFGNLRPQCNGIIGCWKGHAFRQIGRELAGETSFLQTAVSVPGWSRSKVTFYFSRGKYSIVLYRRLRSI